MNRPAIIATLLYLLAAAAVASAQSADSARVKSVRVQTDSIRRETCRGGVLSASGLSCRGATASPRVTVLRRLANRVDSIEKASLAAPAPTPPDTGVASVTFSGFQYYASGTVFFAAPGVDTVTVCYVLAAPTGEPKLAWPPVRVGKGHADSTGWGLRGGNPLTEMCALAIRSSGLTSTDSIPGTWAGKWIDHQGRRIWRPFFSPP